MKALVTGGAGFIGSSVVDALLERNFEVVVVDNLSTGSQNNINSGARFYNLDIRDREKLEGVFSNEKPDYVFHLAAQINVRDSIKNPVNDCEINILGGVGLIEVCRRFAVRKIIFSSTGGAIYGDGVEIPSDENQEKNPAAPYGIAKLTIEKYLQFYKNIYGQDFCVLRYSNVYGPRQNAKGEAGVIAIFIEKLMKGETPIIFGDGEQTRDYVYVRDVARANILAMGLSGFFNVGTGKETSVNTLFRMITKALGVQASEIHGEAVKGELLRSCLNTKKLESKGWKREYSLEKGLEETVQWFKKNKEK